MVSWHRVDVAPDLQCDCIDTSPSHLTSHLITPEISLSKLRTVPTSPALGLLLRDA
jgi:hypothetical protein